MPEQGELIVNVPFVKLFGNTTNLRRDSFIVPKVAEFAEMDNASQTKALALWLAAKDVTPGVVYGIEITSQGSERPSRIPLVRVDSTGASIWKLVQSVEAVERGVAALDQLLYFLNQQSDIPMPIGVLVLCGSEEAFATSSSPNFAFVQSIVAEHKLMVISFEYLKRLITQGKVANLQGLLKQGPRLYTTGTL